VPNPLAPSSAVATVAGSVSALTRGNAIGRSAIPIGYTIGIDFDPATRVRAEKFVRRNEVVRTLEISG
jgi:hypothetical protein